MERPFGRGTTQPNPILNGDLLTGMILQVGCLCHKSGPPPPPKKKDQPRLGGSPPSRRLAGPGSTDVFVEGGAFLK